jgi:hypothetical protein
MCGINKSDFNLLHLGDAVAVLIDLDILWSQPR